MPQLNDQEWRRLRNDFESQASQYHDLKLSVYYVIAGQADSQVKFDEPNHTINLWQHFGCFKKGESLAKFEPTKFGIPGALVSAFAAIIGQETNLFRRMAERAGSLIPDKVCQQITVEIASRFLDSSAEGKPVYACNSNPLAKWLNLVFVTIATHQPHRFQTETLPIDPFAASLVTIDFVIGQLHNDGTVAESTGTKGLVTVDIQQLAHEARSLGIYLQCCVQDLADEQATSLMRRVNEQVLRIRALLPESLALASCDVLARKALQELAEWLDAMGPQLAQVSPPFQVSELEVLYSLAADFDRHADIEARRKSVAASLTLYQRQQLYKKYGASEAMRRRAAREPDDAVERINIGMVETLRRFPETRTWTADDWTSLFFCSAEIVHQTAAWCALESAATSFLGRNESPPTTRHSADSKHPRAFLSYSWDTPEHKSWIKQLATRLRSDGIDVTLDQWHLVPGDQLPRFMESAIRKNGYVVIICTPDYRLKSDERKGGVGYEGDIMTAEVMTERNDRKFIAVLRSGSWDAAMPSWLKGKYSIDLSGNPYSEDQYVDLLLTLLDRREQAPPIGEVPSSEDDQVPSES